MGDRKIPSLPGNDPCEKPPLKQKPISNFSACWCLLCGGVRPSTFNAAASSTFQVGHLHIHSSIRYDSFFPLNPPFPCRFCYFCQQAPLRERVWGI